MNGNWYVQVMGAEIGPLSDDGLREMVAKRQLTRDDMIRKGSSTNWVSAARVRGLFEQATVGAAVQAQAMPSVPLPLSPNTATTQSQPRSEQYVVARPSATKYCQNCGSAGRPKSHVTGTFVTELVLWIICFPVGFVYTIWRLTTKDHVCPSCGAANMIPIDSPKARANLYGRSDILASGVATPQSLTPSFARTTGVEPAGVGKPHTGMTLGTWLLTFIGGLLLLSFPITLISEPHRLLNAFFMSVVGFCLFPFGWQWLSREYDFVKRHGTKIRWGVGISALMTGPLAEPGQTSGSIVYESSERSASIDGSSASGPMPDMNDVAYSVVEAKALAGNKRSIVVKLDQKVSEDVLRSIAAKIKGSDPKQYQRTYIAFYLPGMKVGTGAWATAEFNPNLKVTIIGMTTAQENAIKQLPENPSRQVIGSWWDERPLLHNKMTFFRENGKDYMENRFDDGTSRAIEMSEYSTPRGRKFTNKLDNGDYYVINASGNLEWWDEDGHFLTSRRAD